MEEMKDLKGIVGLSEEEIDEIKRAFLLFGNDSDEIDIQDFKETMKSLKFYEKNPIIYKLILNLSQSNSHKNILTFDEFIRGVGGILGNEYSKEGIRKFFDLFNSVPGENTIKTKDFIQKCGEIGIKLPDHIFNYILNNIQDEDKETLTFDEFYNIMTKNFSI